MHFCPNCHRAVVDEVPYCPTCGTAQNGAAANNARQPSAPPGPVTSVVPPPPVQNSPPPPYPSTTSQAYPPVPQQEQFSYQNRPAKRKSPATAAVLNFLFPGIGYVYNGAGVDSAQVVFGVLCFLALFFGIFVPSVLAALFYPAPASSSVTLPDVLSILVFLVPIALAYDGYKRAEKINERNSIPR
jgi:zinc-ribbon domain